LSYVSRAWFVFAIVLVIVSIASKSWIPFAITVGVLLLAILVAFIMGRNHKPAEETLVDSSKFDDPGDSKWMH